MRQVGYLPECFEEVIIYHQEEFRTSSLQYFTVRLKRSLVADTIRMYMYVRTLKVQYRRRIALV